MNNYYISTKTKDGRYVTDQVPERVYRYVRQLETYIKHPEESKIKEVYWERFGVETKPDPISEDFSQGYRINYSDGKNE